MKQGLTFLKWLTEVAKNLAKEPTPEEAAALPTTLEQRIAVGLVEARARECKHMATDLRLSSSGSLPGVQKIAQYIDNRGLELDQLSLELCKKYPPEVREIEPPSNLIM